MREWKAFFIERPALMVDANNGIRERIVKKCKEALGVFEFRPVRTWRGEFGFDWLRVDEEYINDCETSYVASDRCAGLVESGYKGPLVIPDMSQERTPYQYMLATIRENANLSLEEAQAKIKNEYTIVDNLGSNYYIPVLNLKYGQEANLRILIKTLTVVPKDVYIAFKSKYFELAFSNSPSGSKLGTKIENNLINGMCGIRIPKNFITSINKPKKLTENKPGSQEELILKIKCIKQIAKKESIKVYLQMAEQTEPLRLSGQLNVLPNNIAKQVNLNIFNILNSSVEAIIRPERITKINTAKSIEIGSHTVTDAEIKAANMIFNQALISTKIETRLITTDLDRNLEGHNITQNMTYKLMPFKENNEVDLKPNPFSEYFYSNIEIRRFALDSNLIGHSAFINRLRGLINDNDPIKKSLDNSINVFLLPYDAASQVLLNGDKSFSNYILLSYGRSHDTFAHEILHALQLRHTHTDEDEDKKGYSHPNIKYIFPHARLNDQNPPIDNSQNATTNIMSYNTGKRFSTWRWQWEIMRESPLVKDIT